MGLTDDRQRHIQRQLDFSVELTGEAREAHRGETESSGGDGERERPARTDRLMEEVCERDNLKEALRRVQANKGAAGVDGMTVDALPDHLRQHWPAIRAHLLQGTYTPKPVRRVGDPETGRRGAPAGHPDGAGSLHTASGTAGPATSMGPDVLSAQLRISTGTLGTSGRGPGAALHRRRPPLGGRSPSGKNF